MFPAMVFCILSSDRDFVDDMTCLLCDAGVDVYVASSFDEYAALQADGVALADRGDPREDLGFVLPDPQRFRDHPLGRHWTLTVTVNAQCLIAVARTVSVWEALRRRKPQSHGSGTRYHTHDTPAETETVRLRRLVASLLSHGSPNQRLGPFRAHDVDPQ